MNMSIAPPPSQLHINARHANATFQMCNQSPHLTLHIQLVRRSAACLIIHPLEKPDGLLCMYSFSVVRKLKAGIIYIGCSSRYVPQPSRTPRYFPLMFDQDTTDLDCALDRDSDSDLDLSIPEDGTTVAEYQQVTSVLVIMHEM